MRDQFDTPGDMTAEAHEQWRWTIGLLMVMTLAIEQERRTGVGQGQYRMHTTRSPNVKRAAHE